MRKHWLTTLFGILAATGVGFAHFAATNPIGWLADIGSVLSTIGALGMGMSAADADKTQDKPKEK